MNMKTFDIVSKMVFGRNGCTHSKKNGNYEYFQIGRNVFQVWYKFDLIFEWKYGEVTIDEPQTVANERVIRTVKMILGE